MKKRILEEYLKILGPRKFLLIYEMVQKTNPLWKDMVDVSVVRKTKEKDIHKKGPTHISYFKKSKLKYIEDVAKKILKDEDMLKSIETGESKLTFLGEKITDPRTFFTQKLSEIQNILPKGLDTKTDEELKTIVERFIDNTN